MADAGVGDHADVRCLKEIVAARGAEAFRGLIEVPEAGGEGIAEVAWRPTLHALPGGRAIDGRTQLEDLVREAITRFEILVADGPAAEGHPGLGLEVVRVQRHAASAPDIRGAAEEPQPRIDQVVVLVARVPAAAEIGDVRLVIETAGFEQTDVERCVEQTAGQADAGRTGADDADVGLDQGICRQVS